MQQALTAALVDKCLKITEKEVRNHLRNVCVKKIGILFPELDEDVRTKTADYALIQVASERDRADMIKNLQSILGPYTANFVDWLMVIIRTLSRKTAEVKFDVVHSDVKDHVKNLGQELSNASAARNKTSTKNPEDASKSSSNKITGGRGPNRERDQLQLDSKAPAVDAARRHLGNTDNSGKNALQRSNSGGGRKANGFAVPFSPKHPANNSRKPAVDEAPAISAGGQQRRRRHSASPRDSTVPRDPSPTADDFAGKPRFGAEAETNNDRWQDRYGGPRRRHSISPTPLIDRTHDYEYYNDISYGRERDRRDYDRRRNEDRGRYGDREPQPRQFLRNDMFSNNSRYEGSSRYAESNSNPQRYGSRRRRNSLDREWTPYQRRWSPSFEPPPRQYYSRMYQEKMMRNNNNYYRGGRGNSPLHVVEYRNDRRGRVFDYLPTRDVHAHSKHIISEENKNQIRSVIGAVIGPSSVTTTAADTTTATGGDVPMKSSSDDGFKRPTMPSIHSRLGSKPQRPPPSGGFPRYDQEMLPYSRRDIRNPSEVSQVDSLYERLDIKPEKIRITLRQNYMSRDAAPDRYDDDISGGRYYENELPPSPSRRYDDDFVERFDPPPRYDDEIMMPPPFAPPVVPPPRGEKFYTDDELIRRSTNASNGGQNGNFIDDLDDQRTHISRSSSKKTVNTSVSKRPVSSIAGASAHHCCSCAHTPQHIGIAQQKPVGGHNHHHPQHSPIISVDGEDDDDDIVSIHSAKRSAVSKSAQRRAANKPTASIAAVSTTTSKRRRLDNNGQQQQTQPESSVGQTNKKSTAPSLRSQRLSLSPMSVDNNPDEILQLEPVSPPPTTHRHHQSGSGQQNVTPVRTRNQRAAVNRGSDAANQETDDVIYLQDFSDTDVEELNRHAMLPPSYDPVSPPPPNNDFGASGQFQQNSDDYHAPRSNDHQYDFQPQQQEPLLQQFDESLLYNLDSGMSVGGSSPPPAPPMYIRQQHHRRQQQNMSMLARNDDMLLVDVPQEISLDIPRALSPEARERIIAARNRELALFEQRQWQQQQQQLSSFAGSSTYDVLQDNGMQSMHVPQQRFANNNIYAGNVISNLPRNKFANSVVGMPQQQQQRPVARAMPINTTNNVMQSSTTRKTLPRTAAGAAARQQRQSQPPQNRSNYYAASTALSSSSTFVAAPQQLQPYNAAKSSSKYPASSYAASSVTAPSSIRRGGSGRNPYASSFAAHSSTKYISNKKLDVLDVGRIIANATGGGSRQPQQHRTVSGYNPAAAGRTRSGTSMPPSSSDAFVRPKSATSAVVAASAAAAESAAKPVITKLDSRKLSRLCPWWPLCNRGNYCNNLHPKVSRRCQFGTYCNARSGNCCYQHPHCYFGSQGTCSNLQCPFDHGNANCTEAELELFKKLVAEKPDDAHVVQSPYPPPTTYTRVDWLTDADRELLPEICQMWLRNKCANPQCSQMHRTKQGCMFHPQCVKRLNNDCPYLHPDEVERFLPINKGDTEQQAETAGSTTDVINAVQPPPSVAADGAAPMVLA